MAKKEPEGQEVKKEDEVFKLDFNIIRQGYRARINDKYFLFNVEQTDLVTNNAKRNAKLIICTKYLNNKIYPDSILHAENLEEWTVLKNLTDEELYILGISGIVKPNKAQQKRMNQYWKDNLATKLDNGE